jgi:hypothetical protein
MGMMREQEHGEDGDEARLLVRAEPLGRAEQICRRMVATRMLPTDGALELVANPAWAAAIKKVLVNKGVRVSELRRVEGSLATPLPPAA